MPPFSVVLADLPYRHNGLSGQSIRQAGFADPRRPQEHDGFSRPPIGGQGVHPLTRLNADSEYVDTRRRLLGRADIPAGILGQIRFCQHHHRHPTRLPRQR